MEYKFNIRKVLTVLLICLALGCSESDSGNSSNDFNNGGFNNGRPGNYVSNNTSGKSCNSYKPIPGAFDAAQRHIYLGEFRLDRNSGSQGIYRSFLGDFATFCNNNGDGFQYQFNPNTGRWEYAYNWSRGVSNCSNWDDFFKVWIVFPRNSSARAHLVVDATMSGCPDGLGGQCYDVQRISMPDAEIDCREPDKTVIYFEPNPGAQFRVNIYQGDKNSERLRAEVFYRNGPIGKSDFFIIQN